MDHRPWTIDHRRLLIKGDCSACAGRVAPKARIETNQAVRLTCVVSIRRQKSLSATQPALVWKVAGHVRLKYVWSAAGGFSPRIFKFTFLHSTHSTLRGLRI